MLGDVQNIFLINELQTNVFIFCQFPTETKEMHYQLKKRAQKCKVMSVWGLTVP